jgi:peptide/nickel transport system substrate-binding protein
MTVRGWLAGLMLLASACRRSDAPHLKYDGVNIDTTPATGGTYIEASIGDASFLNPILASDSASNDINALVYNGLIKYDKNLKLTGDLAERWDISDGGRRITFHLRRGVKWHDGQPFTSADALFTYETLVASTTRTPFASDYQQVVKAEAPDPYTFRVTYKEPFAPAMESWGMGMIPRHVFVGTDVNSNPANRSPIGTGPYRFSSWVPDEKIILKANPDYYLGRPYIDRYVYRIIPDLSVQFLELRQGSLSMMHPTPDQYNGYKEFFLSYNKFHYPAPRYDYLAFNLNRPLFQDKRVRQAMAYAIDKQEIIDGVYQGLAVPSTGPFPPSSWACDPSIKPYPFDLARAKALLAQAGWSDSDHDGVLDRNGKKFEFTIVTNQGNKVRETMALILQNGLARVGIKVDVRIVEWSVFVEKIIKDKQFDSVLLGWNLTPDPDCYLIWNSSQNGPGQYNFVSYKNAEVDRLIDEARHTFDMPTRTRDYHRIHAIIADEQPYLFLSVPEALPVVHKKILGVELAPAGLGWNFEKWFIPKAWQTIGYAS